MPLHSIHVWFFITVLARPCLCPSAFWCPLSRPWRCKRNGERFMEKAECKKHQSKEAGKMRINVLFFVWILILHQLLTCTGLEVIQQADLTPSKQKPSHSFAQGITSQWEATKSAPRHVEVKVCTNSHAWTGRSLNCKDQWSSTVRFFSLPKNLWGKLTSNTFQALVLPWLAMTSLVW